MRGIGVGRGRVAHLVALGAVALVAGALAVSSTAQVAGDYGDAPDGQPALYPGPLFEVEGNFPTRWDATARGTTSLPGRAGAYHLDSSEVWLGPLWEWIEDDGPPSREVGALDFNDPDGTPNLVDGDGGEGGIHVTIVWDRLPARASFQLAVTTAGTVTVGESYYLNVLVDVDQDGRWNGWRDWAVRDLQLLVTAAPVPQPESSRSIVRGRTTVIETDWFPLGVLTSEDADISGATLALPTWVRVTLTDTPIGGVGGVGDPVGGVGQAWDGSAPAGGFAQGETEDYYLTYCPEDMMFGMKPIQSMNLPNIRMPRPGVPRSAAVTFNAVYRNRGGYVTVADAPCNPPPGGPVRPPYEANLEFITPSANLIPGTIRFRLGPPGLGSPITTCWQAPGGAWTLTPTTMPAPAGYTIQNELCCLSGWCLMSKRTTMSADYTGVFASGWYPYFGQILPPDPPQDEVGHGSVAVAGLYFPPVVEIGFVDQFGGPQDEVYPDSEIFLWVLDPEQNEDPEAEDSFWLLIVNETSVVAIETLLVETGPDTGEFRSGAIDLVALEAGPGDVIGSEHHGAWSSVLVAGDEPGEGYMVFVDSYGQPGFAFCLDETLHVLLDAAAANEDSGSIEYVEGWIWNERSDASADLLFTETTADSGQFVSGAVYPEALDSLHGDTLCASAWDVTACAGLDDCIIMMTSALQIETGRIAELIDPVLEFAEDPDARLLALPDEVTVPMGYVATLQVAVVIGPGLPLVSAIAEAVAADTGVVQLSDDELTPDLRGVMRLTVLPQAVGETTIRVTSGALSVEIPVEVVSGGGEPLVDVDALSFVNIPNPIRDASGTLFLVEGPGAVYVEAMRVVIYDLAYRVVFEEEGPGSSLAWAGAGHHGLPLANGTYAYRVDVLVGGEWLRSTSLQMLTLLR